MEKSTYLQRRARGSLHEIVNKTFYARVSLIKQVFSCITAVYSTFFLKKKPLHYSCVIKIKITIKENVVKGK